MALIYVSTKSKVKRKRKTKKSLAAEREHQKFLRKIGFTGKAKKPNFFPDIKIEPFEGSSLQKMFEKPGGFKRSIDDARWRSGISESTKTLNEIDRKKSKIAPAYNKGPNMYITDKTDPKEIGKKTG